MKKKSLFILMTVVLTQPAFCTELTRLPGGSAGEVTLNWQKFNELWSTLQDLDKKVHELEKPQNLPPVPFALTKAAYKGEVLKNKVVMNAVFQLEIFEPKKWVTVPFLPDSVALHEALLDGEPVGVVQDNGFHALVLNKPGRHILRVAFSLRAPKQEEAPELHFDIPSTPMTVLALEFPRAHLDVSIEPSQGIDVQPNGANATLVTAAIPPTSAIEVHWQKALPEEPNEPPKVYLDTESLLTVSEGTQKVRWNLNYNILHHGVRDLRLGVPDGWNILSVACEGLQEWKPLDTPQGPMLDAQLAYAKKGTLQVQVEAEKGIGEKENVVELPQLRAVDVEREQGTIGIEAKGAVEVQVREANGLNAIDPQELPGTVWQAATQPILYAFRYTKPHTLTIAMTRHPEVPVLTTTIDDANAVTLMTDRGQVITHVRYQVRNHLKQYLAVRLPQGTELWSAFVDGQPVKPTQTETGAYRIPLAKSQIEGEGQQGFPVELVYYQATSHFWPLGYKSSLFPVPDAPISRVWWSVYLPERYRFLHFGGDLEKGELADAWSMLAGGAAIDELEEKKSAPESARYFRSRRKDLQRLAAKKGVMNAAMPASAPRSVSGSAGGGALQGVPLDQQEAMESDLLDKGQAREAGVYPIAFQVPASGQLFHFGQVMVIGQSPKLTMWYLHVGFVRGFFALLMGALGCFLYGIRLQLMRWTRLLSNRLMETRSLALLRPSSTRVIL